MEIFVSNGNEDFEESVIGNRVFKRMSDGVVRVENLVKSPGTQYGDYCKVSIDATEEQVAEAKELLVKQMCEKISEIAKTNEDFFIIKEIDGHKIIGWKIILPTVEDK